MTGRTLSWTATTNGWDDAAFKGLGVTLDSTLNYTVYGDSEEKTADSSKTLYYHFVRQGGYILPEQYVKLAADVADRTAYSGSDAVFAIYKASEVTRNKKGELVLGENAKLSDRIGAFETSRELPEGDYYVVRTGMEASYTNVKPGDQTLKIGEAFYPYQLVTVTAGTEENAVEAEFEDYNAPERPVYPRKEVLCAGRHARYKLQPFRGVYADRAERPHLHGEGRKRKTDHGLSARGYLYDGRNGRIRRFCQGGQQDCPH